MTTIWVAPRLLGGWHLRLWRCILEGGVLHLLWVKWIGLPRVLRLLSGLLRLLWLPIIGGRCTRRGTISARRAGSRRARRSPWLPLPTLLRCRGWRLPLNYGDGQHYCLANAAATAAAGSRASAGAASRGATPAPRRGAILLLLNWHHHDRRVGEALPGIQCVLCLRLLPGGGRRGGAAHGGRSSQ